MVMVQAEFGIECQREVDTVVNHCEQYRHFDVRIKLLFLGLSMASAAVLNR